MVRTLRIRPRTLAFLALASVCVASSFTSSCRKRAYNDTRVKYAGADDQDTTELRGAPLPRELDAAVVSIVLEGKEAEEKGVARSALTGTLVRFEGDPEGAGVYVVTAAHGFSKNRDVPAYWKVSHTSYQDDTYGAVKTDVESITLHPDTDLALLRIKPLESKEAKALVVAPSSLKLAPTDTLWAVGWGRTSDTGFSLPAGNDRTFGEMVFVKEHASLALGEFKAMPAIEVKGKNGAVACGGDSGGPLYVKVGTGWNVVGAVHMSMVCDNATSPTYFTDLRPHLDWLKERMKP